MNKNLTIFFTALSILVFSGCVGDENATDVFTGGSNTSYNKTVVSRIFTILKRENQAPVRIVSLIDNSNSTEAEQAMFTDGALAMLDKIKKYNFTWEVKTTTASNVSDNPNSIPLSGYLYNFGKVFILKTKLK